MVAVNFLNPSQIALEISQRSREKRLSLNLSQKSLSERSGVSLGVIKKFELSGQISLPSLLKIALVLESLGEFMELFKSVPKTNFLTLDNLLKRKARKRGRQ